MKQRQTLASDPPTSASWRLRLWACLTNTQLYAVRGLNTKGCTQFWVMVLAPLIGVIHRIFFVPLLTLWLVLYLVSCEWCHSADRNSDALSAHWFTFPCIYTQQGKRWISVWMFMPFKSSCWWRCREFIFPCPDFAHSMPLIMMVFAWLVWHNRTPSIQLFISTTVALSKELIGLSWPTRVPWITTWEAQFQGCKSVCSL